MCGATSHMMKDELMVGEHQVDGTWLLIYIYIYLYIDVQTFFAILVSQVRCYCNLYLFSLLLQCIGQNFCMNYNQIVVFLYIILRVIILFYFLCQ